MDSRGQNTPMPDAADLRKYRIRIALFLLSVVLVLLFLSILYSVINTLDRLSVVESERDQWQRPSDVIRAMDLRDGNVVVDLGSGAGYFALKLSSIVGKRGEVVAVDIRKLSLLFLRVRAILRNQHNLRVIVGDLDNPHMPLGADAVLICNTYHEFQNPGVMLDYTFRSLRPGGRLVIVDRGPTATGEEHGENVAHDHEVAFTLVENELRDKGFEILSRQDRFIDRPGDDLWWLVTARRP